MTLGLIKGINKSKILTKHISYECKCEFEKWNQKRIMNNDKCWCAFKKRKKIIPVEKIIFGILLHVVVKMVDI